MTRQTDLEQALDQSVIDVFSLASALHLRICIMQTHYSFTLLAYYSLSLLAYYCLSVHVALKLT